jgi:deazaflavin-dependent oxidoreductase (nitroreductase family)
MPFPGVVARFNRRVTNPVIGGVAGTVGSLAIVEHRGRRTGKRYRTPVMAFPKGEDVIFALTYGTEVDWVKNVIAAGGCTIEYRRRSIRLAGPRLEQGSPAAAFPWVVRTFLRLLRVRDVLRLRVVAGA